MIQSAFNWLTGLPRAKPQKKQPAVDFRGEQQGVPVHHLVYEKKRQPDGYGANRYAYELLQLVPFSPISRAVRVRRQISIPFGPPQVWAGQALKLNGIPSMAGGMFTGGMMNADGTMADFGTDSTINLFAVATNNPNANANDVSAVFSSGRRGENNDPMGGGN